MAKEITTQDYVVSVGSDWNKNKIVKALAETFRGIRAFVANPKHNHFKITVTVLRKGSKDLAKAGVNRIDGIEE